MSETATTTTASPPADSSFLERHHFLLRRLHSLSGVVPVGVFVIMHLLTNFQLAVGSAVGRDLFQHEVDFIHMTPALLFVEVGLWLSIAFHAGLGLIYTFSGRPNVQHYPYGGNVRYTLQRTTGIIALVFIFLHIATLRWRWNLLGWETPFDPHNATQTVAQALQFAWWVPVLYLVGALSVVFHWANGLWTAAITWGLTISVAAQRRWGYACAALGVVLTLFTIGAVVAATRHDLASTPTIQVHAEPHPTPEAPAVSDGSPVTEAARTGSPQWRQTH
jgi:succinate dehydrogenase / fumarate reductase cytochrome b subunit